MPEKKTAKKTAKATPKAITMPPNPTRAYGATVRSVKCSAKEAAALVSDFEFRIVADNAGTFELVADAVANKAFEASR